MTVRACDVVQPDLAHCGGLSIGKKIGALAAAQNLLLAPHCSIGPVALCAAVHFRWATPNVLNQEHFGDYDVPGAATWSSAGTQPTLANMPCPTAPASASNSTMRPALGILQEKQLPLAVG